MKPEELKNPVQLGKSLKMSKEKTGLLMEIINALLSNLDKELKDQKIKKFEQDFLDNDKRLNNLVESHQEYLSNITQMFVKVYANVDISKSKCRTIKEILLECKKLLNCKRDEVKGLWLQAIGHKQTSYLLTEIGTLSEVPEKVVLLLKDREYVKATELLVKSIIFMEDHLSNVDALKQLNIELKEKKDILYNALLYELHMVLYVESTSQVLTHSNKHNLSRFQDHKQELWSYNNSVHIKSDISNTFCNSKKSLDISISELVQCFILLQCIPDIILVVEEKCEKELLVIVHSTAKQVTTSFQNLSCISHKHNLSSILNKQQENLLLNLFESVLKQFKCVLNCYKILFGKMLSDTNESQLKFDFFYIWSKIQTVLKIVIEEYVDSHNYITTYASNTSGIVTTPLITEMNSFFSNKKLLNPTTNALFKFGSSSHALNMQIYLQEQKTIHQGNEDAGNFDSETKIHVCPLSYKNIITIFKPLCKFITEVEEEFNISKVKDSPLQTFLYSCVDVYLEQISLEINNLFENISKNIKNYTITSNKHELKNISKISIHLYVLESAVQVDNILNEFNDLLLALPKHSDNLLQILCNLLLNYHESCQTEYSSLIHPHSADKQIISSIWVRDEVISHFLKSIPNWKKLNITTSREFKESYEETKLTNEKVYEIFISNLPSETSVSSHEILMDPHCLYKLGLLHESLYWLSYCILNFSSSLQKNVLLEETSEVKSDNIFMIFSNLLESILEIKENYVNLADVCLIILHLEIRLHCFYYLQFLSNQNYNTRSDNQEPDLEILKLITDITKIYNLLQSVLKPSSVKYIFEGIGHFISTIFINNVKKIKQINENGIRKIIRNIYTLQQNLNEVIVSEEIALDRAKQYYNLLNQTPEEILNSIVEKGSQFEKQEYSAILSLWCRNHLCTSSDADNYLKQLEKIF